MTTPKDEPIREAMDGPARWLGNNHWAAERPMFSYQELMKMVDDLSAITTQSSAKVLARHIKHDLENALFAKAYEETLQKKRAAFRKEQEELGDRLLFGEDLEKFKESLNEPGVWTNLPQTGTEKEIFAAFRTRLFMWYLENSDAEDVDGNQAIAFVNSISHHLGDPTLQDQLKQDSHGTGKYRTDCPDC